jgi:hypothetical protein
MGTDLAVDGTPLWDGYSSNRDRDLRRHYGMKLAHYEQLLELQGGECAIEGCHVTGKDGDPLQVDEDPVTKAIRGLLCRKHNRKLDDRQSRYVTNPPAAPLGWVVPDKQWQARAARNAGRARRHQEARLQQAAPASSSLGRLQEMTRPDPDDFQARIGRALADTAAVVPEATRVPDPPAYGWTEPPPRQEPPPEPEPRGWRRLLRR